MARHRDARAQPVGVTRIRDGAGAAVSLETLKRAACRAVDARGERLAAVAREIHTHPELAFEEQRAAALLVATLCSEGISVEAGCYGLATAFESRSDDDGPTVALPGIGHACGHNLIATAAVGAGLALAALGARLPGRVRESFEASRRA